MTTKVKAAMVALALLAGCGREESPASAPAAPSPEAVAERKARDERFALSDRLEAVDRELASGAADEARSAELREERKRLAGQIRKANDEQFRRDREEVRRRISENRKKEVQK